MSEAATFHNNQDNSKTFGLDSDEWARITERLGREATAIEAKIFASLWSEEVGFKSSAALLKVIDNASDKLVPLPGMFGGAVAFGDSLQIIAKAQHNDFGFRYDPQQGIPVSLAAAMLNAAARGAEILGVSSQFFLSELDKADSLSRFQSAVAAISDFSQLSGTLLCDAAWQINESYLGNSMCDSICVAVRQSTVAQASAMPDDPLLMIGAATGYERLRRNDSASHNATAPICDAFLHYRISKALQELYANGLLSSAVALHYGGLAVATIRLAQSIASVVELDLNRIPHNLQQVTADNLLFSESAARVLICVPKAQLRKVSQILGKWEVAQQTCGKVSTTLGLEINYNHKIIADIPLKFALGGGSSRELRVVKFPPMLKAKDNALRQATAPKKFQKKESDEWSLIRNATKAAEKAKEGFKEPTNLADTWVDLLANLNFASKKLSLQRSDDFLGGNALIANGGLGKLISLPGSAQHALAVTSATTPLYTSVDPYLGMTHSVAQAIRNLASLGANPLGLSFVLHYGHPEKYKDVCNLSESIRALGDATKHWQIPILDADISLGNGSDAYPLLPTPVITMLGQLPLATAQQLALYPSEGDKVFLIGQSHNEFSCSEYSRYIHRYVDAKAIANINFDQEHLLAQQVSKFIQQGLVTTCRSLAAGGLGYALAAALLGAAKPLGVTLKVSIKDLRSDAQLFGESAGRYLLFTPAAKYEALAEQLSQHNITIEAIGTVGNREFELTGSLNCTLPVATAYRIWNQASERALS